MQSIKQLYSRFHQSVSTSSALMLMMVLGLVVVPDLAFAAETVTDVAERVEGQFVSLKSLALAIAFFIGTVLFIAGLWMVYKDSKQPGQGHAKNGFIACLIGAGLLSVTTLIGITAESVTEDGDTAAEKVEAEEGF